MLPNLLLIGAMKCGTTSLHSYLDLHPEIQMSEHKELDFFVDPTEAAVEKGNWTRGLEWYESWFQEGSRVRGESSHHYTAYPMAPGVPARAAQVVPDAKLIYMVRDPIKRMESHYLERRVSALQPDSFEDAMRRALEDPENDTFIARSSYFRQVERWLEHYPRERLMVIALEDMRDRREERMAEVFRFLEVDDTFRSEGFERNANPGEARREVRAQRVVGAIERRRRARSKQARLNRSHVLPAQFRRVGRGVWRRTALRPVRRPALSPQLRERVQEVLRPDVERLREFTGEAYESWSI